MSDLDRLDNALEVMLKPASALAPPSPVPPSAERLRRFLNLRQQLGVIDALPSPISEAAAAFGLRCGGPAARGEELTDLALELLKRIDHAIIEAIDAGYTDERLIRTADFAEIRTLVIPDADRDPQGNPCALVLVAGCVNSLPVRHRLRDVLPAADLYDIDGNGRVLGLVLGRPMATMHGSGPPRRYYMTADAIRHTQSLRHQQRLREQEREQEQRREQERLRREWANSPLGRLDAAQRELERLRAAGKVPEPLPPPPPTIRIGR